MPLFRRQGKARREDFRRAIIALTPSARSTNVKAIGLRPATRAMRAPLCAREARCSRPRRHAIASLGAGRRFTKLVLRRSTTIQRTSIFVERLYSRLSTADAHRQAPLRASTCAPTIASRRRRDERFAHAPIMKCRAPRLFKISSATPRCCRAAACRP